MRHTTPPGMLPGMAEAARLTRAGKLGEATTLLQRLLRGDGKGEPAPAPNTTAPGTTLEGEFVRLDPTPSAKDAGPQPANDSGCRRSGAKPRTGLGETLRGLAARFTPNGLHGGTPRPAPDPLPDGASFARLSYSGAAGTRAYKLYVPAAADDRPRPLVVMLHGCTQSPDDFAAGTRMNAFAERHGILVAYPEQPASANAQRCWNWFKPEDQRRDQGEPSLLAGITRQIMRDHRVDPERVYIAGLSAGGAAAANMAAAYPDLYAAVGVHSGLPAGAAQDLPSALAAMRQGGSRSPRAAIRGNRRVPTIVFHGDRDHVVHPSNGDGVIAQATTGFNLRSEMQQGQSPGGHAYNRNILHAPDGRTLCEHWTIHGAGHAWAGGSPSGSYTDPQGPDATAEMLRFFLDHRLETSPR
ncbi:PHB depolymerase family esterase [Azospirillum melinis]|uniref:PHB depolymerase family esterase n=1 Tax=Azospirillum melinis TaxID=328839 RepID=A0ABX2KMX2_9PROT|nr:PHB depolymerase family esterase [Azospirillum melinis]MBP2306717.1 poly(hydroxyalkanoate) depolymerase family esterase [Azospirillum melinis]NUB02846.1 PHB depolymerase family esterase [Azospirillum melinis]